MTTVSTQAAAARESARQRTGKFGTQVRSDNDDVTLQGDGFAAVAERLGLPDDDDDYEVIEAIRCLQDPEDMLWIAQNTTDSGALWALGNNLSADAQTQFAIAHGTDRDAQVAIAGWTGNQEVLEHLSNSEHESVQDNVCRNIHTSPAILAEKAKDPRFGPSVGNNFATPAQTLTDLSKAPCRDTRRAVAGNVSTDPDTIDVLSEDPDEWIREAVVWNVSTRAATRVKLLKDPSKNVRAAASRCALTPAAALADAVQDPSPKVLAALADNPTARAKTRAAARSALDSMPSS